MPVIFRLSTLLEFFSLEQMPLCHRYLRHYNHSCLQWLIYIISSHTLC
jgi:hypothetical protein